MLKVHFINITLYFLLIMTYEDVCDKKIVVSKTCSLSSGMKTYQVSCWLQVNCL